jgi:hypothetical protein
VFTDKDVGTCDWALGDDVCPKQVRPWFCRIITWHGSRAGAGHQSATSLPQDCCYRHQHIHSHTHTSSSHLHFSSSSPPPHCSRPPIPEHINKSLLTSSSPQSVTVTRSRPPTPPFSILADRPLLPDPTKPTSATTITPTHILPTAQCCWLGSLPLLSDSSLFRPTAPNPTLGFCPRKPDHPANPP